MPETDIAKHKYFTDTKAKFVPPNRRALHRSAPETRVWTSTNWEEVTDGNDAVFGSDGSGGFAIRSIDH